MKITKHKWIKVTYPDEMTESEAKQIAEMEREDWWENLNHKALGFLDITIDDEGIKVHGKEAPPVERLRRITGYLSPVNKWNNGKIGELRDRVKHT